MDKEDNRIIPKDVIIICLVAIAVAIILFSFNVPNYLLIVSAGLLLISTSFLLVKLPSLNREIAGIEEEISKLTKKESSYLVNANNFSEQLIKGYVSYENLMILEDLGRIKESEQNTLHKRKVEADLRYVLLQARVIFREKHLTSEEMGELNKLKLDELEREVKGDVDEFRKKFNDNVDQRRKLEEGSKKLKTERDSMTIWMGVLQVIGLLLSNMAEIIKN